MLLIAGIVYLNEGERKIPVAYARRVRGNKLYGGAQSYLPLKVNQAGMIPLIFAISVLLFPQFLAQVVTIFSVHWGLKLNAFRDGIFGEPARVRHRIFPARIPLHVFLYGDHVQSRRGFEKSPAERRVRSGHPAGREHGEFFSGVVNRMTLWGAIFLGLVAVLPIVVQKFTGVATLTISGTAILIVVAVALETMRQVDSQLTMREYEGIE